MEVYCICMFYLNEQTDHPILIGIHKVYTYNAYRYTVQNMYINIRWFMFYLRYASVGLKSNVTSASHKDWFYHNLIHVSHCQKNFPNVFKTYGVTVQSKSCLIYFA